MPMKKKCNVCYKMLNEIKFRKNRGKCIKCEYQIRKDYLKQYSKDNYKPYKDLSIEQKQKRSIACKKYYEKNYISVRKNKIRKENIVIIENEIKRQNKEFNNIIQILI